MKRKIKSNTSQYSINQSDCRNFKVDAESLMSDKLVKLLICASNQDLVLNTFCF